MYLFKTLNNIDTKIIYDSFMEAFSDYSVNLFLPYKDFKTMLINKGFNPCISLRLFHNNKLIGFVLNGKRKWNGKETAYDMGTAIIPDYRTCGFSKKMIVKVTEILKENNIEQYLLEVIQNNIKAFELYKSQGFQITRNFSVLQADIKPSISFLSSSYTIEAITDIDESMWSIFKNFWDFSPSWQNSIDSIKATKEIFTYIVVKDKKNIIGYGVIEKKSGKIPQLAVNKNYRNKSIGKNILYELVKNTDSNSIKLINIDRKYKNMENFLINLGFQISSMQYEMILNIK